MRASKAWVAAPSAKEVRMAPMRAGLAGMSMRQPGALVAIGMQRM
jgi:hypothetical protein